MPLLEPVIRHTFPSSTSDASSAIWSSVLGCENLGAVGWKVKALEGDAKAAHAKRIAMALLVFILIVLCLSYVMCGYVIIRQCSTKLAK